MLFVRKVQFKVFASVTWATVCSFSFQVDEALMIKNTDIAKELCLPPVKLHCSSMFSVISFTLLFFYLYTF